MLYLGCTLWLAEERGLGCEESEVFVVFVQAAVPAAHAVTAGHGGGRHCVDSHGAVQSWPPALVRRPSDTLMAWGSAGLSREGAGLMLTLRTNQSLQAYSCPLLIQKKSALLCWCIQKVYVPLVTARQVKPASDSALCVPQDQDIRERAQNCHFLLMCVCACSHAFTHPAVDAPGHLQLHTHTQHVSISHTRTQAHTAVTESVYRLVSS